MDAVGSRELSQNPLELLRIVHMIVDVFSADGLHGGSKLPGVVMLCRHFGVGKDCELNM